MTYRTPLKYKHRLKNHHLFEPEDQIDPKWLPAIVHDASLNGEGNTASPLAVAISEAVGNKLTLRADGLYASGTGSSTNFVTQSITDGDTGHAPSGNAVFDALALKAPLNSPPLTGNPTAPTQPRGATNTRLANTEFVRTPSVQAVVSSATVTPTFDDDMVKVTAQAAALALANPTGTPIPELGMVIRIKDDGTARAITYDTEYRAIGITLPTTTVVGKTTYIAMIYNSDDTTWDCIATRTEA